MTQTDAAASEPSGAALVRARSLQARITGAILFTVILVLLVGCSLFMLEQQRTERSLEERRLEQIAVASSEDFARSLNGADEAAAADILRRQTLFDRVVGGELRTTDGRTFATAHRSYIDPSRIAAARRYSHRLTWKGRRVGSVMLFAEPLAMTSPSRYVALGGALFFAATATALFLGRWLAARITTPLTRLSEAMDVVGRSGTFQLRVTPDAPDEVGQLTEHFNVLMGRLQVKNVALRRTLTELVEARDAAEAATVAKSQFLANMSHEIRTPLNGVLAMAQILMRGPLGAEQHGQVEVIHQSGETLLSLLNDILDVSKIEAGKLELELTRFDPQAVADAAVAAFRPVAARKGLALEIEAEPAAGWREGDPVRLRQILNNFLSNALKFTEAGAVRVRLSGEGADGAGGLRLEVSDTGMGIAPDKLPLLFQQFTQLDASTTRRFGGTGLGLAICRELAEMMGGEVAARSVEGEGSAFSVVLPLPRAPQPLALAEPSAAIPEPAPVDADAASPPAAPEPGEVPAEGVEAEEDAPGPLRVLAAEDNATNQLVLTTVMQIFGCELTLAGDGEEAVARWREGAFDVILMDIQMPRLDGVSATRRIRAEEAAVGRARTPILALSANALTHQVESYLAAGMDGHVAKPIELEKLQAALEAVLSPPVGEEAAEAAA